MALPLSTATLIAGIVTAVGSTAVGVSAIVFAWRNVKVTLRQQRLLAADQRPWEAQRKVYQELAERLAAHHLAGADDPFNQPNVLLPYTSDPGLELQAKARLFAVDPIVTALSRLRDDAIVEAKLSKIFKNAIEYGGMFEDYSLSKMMQWKHPNDAQRQLDKLREDWDAARQDLEIALREVYRPNLHQSPSPPRWPGLMSPPESAGVTGEPVA